MKLEEYLPFWDKLTGAQQRRLTGSAALRHFDRGAMVYGGGAECAGLILPVEGQLRAYLLTDEGRELTLYRLFPRDMCLFSASCVLRGIQFDVLVEAERDTVALFLPAEVYHGLMEESAAVANFTNELMADRFSEVMRRMDQLLSRSWTCAWPPCWWRRAAWRSPPPSASPTTGWPGTWAPPGRWSPACSRTSRPTGW